MNYHNSDVYIYIQRYEIEGYNKVMDLLKSELSAVVIEICFTAFPSMSYLSNIPSGSKEKFLELTKSLCHRSDLKSLHCFQRQLIKLMEESLQTNNFKTGTIVMEILVIVNEVDKIGEDACYSINWKSVSQLDVPDLDTGRITILSNLLKLMGNSEIILSEYIQSLGAYILISTICTLSVFIQNKPHLLHELSNSHIFWDKLLDCLQDPHNSSIRKKAIFLLHYLVSNGSSIECDKFSEEKLEMWANVLLVLETLEETQGHIIQSIISRIPIISSHVANRQLSVRWLSAIFNRFMYQESRMLSRWGMQLVLDLDPTVFVQDDNIKELEKLLFDHLSQTYMFYRPNFVDKGDCPPIVTQLKAYLEALLKQLSEVQCNRFLKNLFEFLGRPKLGTVPLIMLSYVVANITIKFEMCSDILDCITIIIRCIVPTQPHLVKGCVQGFLLKFIVQSTSNTGVGLVSFQRFLDALWLNYFLDKDHPTWIKTSSFIRNDLSPDIDGLLDNLSKQLTDESDHNLYTQGLGLIFAMSPKNHLTKTLVYPLQCCGSNLYISTKKIITTAELVNIVFKYNAHGRIIDNDILKGLAGDAHTIFDNCCIFLTRYTEVAYLKTQINNKVSVYTEAIKDIENFAALIINICKHCLSGENREFQYIHETLASVKLGVNEIPVIIQSSALIKPLHGRHIAFRNVGYQDYGWLIPYLSSNNVHILESSWTCFSYLVLIDTEECRYCDYLNLAVENIQKIKDPFVVTIILGIINNIASSVVQEDPHVLCESIRPLWVCLEDFLNCAVYWDLLTLFCGIVFNHHFMDTDSEECFEIITHWWDFLLELSIEKENVLYHLSHSILSYNTPTMRNIHRYLSRYVDLAIVGILQNRVKQNMKDVTCFIEEMGADVAVNGVYIMLNKSTPLIRMKTVSFIHSVLEEERHTNLVLPVFENLLTTFLRFEKAALINSLPNRMRIRIWQTILCLMPVIIKNTPPKQELSIFQRIMSCFTVDSQPSVRCFIESCVCVMLPVHHHLITHLYDILDTIDIHTNSFLTATMSIIVHHIVYLSMANALTTPMLDEALQHITVWVCCNNFNVRNFSSACALQLRDVYNSNSWQLPAHHVPQFKYLQQSKDYQRYYQKTVNLNMYFSKFNICKDLCLANIFNSLLVQFNILENEYVEMKDLLKFSSKISYPVFSGDFYKLPRPAATGHENYLIRFKDVQDNKEIQKKITPWQIMACNLGIDFDRNVIKKGELVLFASLISKATNLGGLCRTGEIFGVKSMIVNNMDILRNREFLSLSMTSEKWVDFRQIRYDDCTQYLKSMKQQGYMVIGVEQTSNSVSLENFEFPKKSLLVLGRENAGIPVDLLDHLDVCVEIPQLGLIRSLNVHVSGSIMIWEYSKQHSFVTEDVKLQNNDKSGS